MAEYKDLSRIRVCYDSRLLRVLTCGWAAGMVCYPYMLFKRPRDQVSEQLFRHELAHAYQIQRIGWFRYYLQYLWESLRYGYQENMFEVLARYEEKSPLTLGERDLMSNRRWGR